MRRAAALALLLAAAALAPPARAEEDPSARVLAALVEAAKGKDAPARVGRVLEQADALIGKAAGLSSQGDLADWLGRAPKEVASMPVVRVRRAWLYVASRRGKDALPLLDEAVAAEPTSALLASYLGEARRQAGDATGAVEAWGRSLDLGGGRDKALEGAVLDGWRALLGELHGARDADPTDALPRYATAAAPILARRPVADVAEWVHDSLAWDADRARPDAARVARLRAEAARAMLARLAAPVADADRTRLARKAFEAAAAARGAGGASADVPAFDLLAGAVRLGDRGDADGHAVPEALAALAEEALSRGRFVLAERMARRRLAISDSPRARKVLEQVPADVGD